ncbi:Transcription elongation factor spt5 [Mollisiaceae sp. DMI_Dod_QoI]|nr:Transcription elongation factor spt5 [Helotiales sp. DMI_Dod_QoI]
MSTSNLLSAHFDDSEDEDDNFNPQPADVSDNEDAGGSDHDDDAGAQIRNEASKRRADEDSDDEVTVSKSRPANEDGEGDDEDAEGEGEDTAPGANDDDDEEDEDDEEEEITGHRRKRRRERRNQFLDVEAEVDEDEDENDDDEDELDEIKNNFIADTHPDDVEHLPEGGERDDRRHRELDRRREMEQSLDAEKQAELWRQRYGTKNRTGRAIGDSAVVPKRLLLPSVDDPSIWAVRCKEGKEREVVFSIMKRIEERMGTKEELAITCAFERGGTQSTMKGFIYVEAQRQADVMAALDGMMNVYPRTKCLLVEIKEMPDLLRVTKTPSMEPGAYVRLRRPPKYAGDLAQVIDVTDTGLEVRVRYVPRLDYGLHDDANAPADAFGAKRKRPTAGPRPPQRLFSEVEAKKRHAKYLQGRPDTKTWNYMGDEYVNGYCEKEVKIQVLVTKDVNPTLEEVTRFASGAEDGTENLDLNALAASLKASTANASYLPGDIIEVYEGEQKGVVGKAVSVQGDIVTMAVSEGDLRGQTIEVPVKGLRKRFREGDHVKVIGGSRFRDEVGMVVKISEDRVTLLTDQGNTEVTVFSKDLREASDSGGSGSLGQYELWDLVQLDPSTVGCVVKVDRESLVVLDQNSQTRTVLPSQISNKLEKRKHAVATDKNGSEIRLDDVVKEHGGESRSGKIIHIHRAYLFLRNSAQSENAGVFVTRTTNVATVSAKGGRLVTSSGPDLNSMNPAMKRNAGGANGDMAPPKTFGRDRSIGQTVTIRKGPYKGLLGIVKETTDTSARVELHTKSKTVNVPKDALGFKDRLTGQSIDPLSRGGGARGGYTPRGGSRGGMGNSTPGGWDGGRTPMPAGGTERTPAWGTSRTPASGANGGRTPAWKSSGDGGRTPGWADGSRTANPYDGSRTAYGAGNRTPAWSSGAKTPAYGLQQDAFNAGSKTPGYTGSGDAWGSGAKTPAYQPQAASNDNAWSAPPPANNWGSNTYDAPTPGAHMSAPTPAAMNAPTPGAYSAPTPAPYNAPTPAAAPTPAPGWGGGWGAPTPQAMDAPTPGAQQYYAAPTPGAYGMPETPAANWQDDGPRYVD